MKEETSHEEMMELLEALRPVCKFFGDCPPDSTVVKCDEHGNVLSICLERSAGPKYHYPGPEEIA